jgi:hypothetical protein
MLQEKWIKIILTPRRIYVYILMSYYMLLFTNNLTVRNFKFLLPLYISVKEILETSTLNLSVKSLAVSEIWDFSRLWDVTLCNPVDGCQFFEEQWYLSLRLYDITPGYTLRISAQL